MTSLGDFFSQHFLRLFYDVISAASFYNEVTAVSLISFRVKLPLKLNAPADLFSKLQDIVLPSLDNVFTKGSF